MTLSLPTGAAGRACLALTAMLVAHATPLGAQVPVASSADTADVRPPRSEAQRSARDESGPLLDAPVSRAEYRLGAGDEVDVAIFGDYNEVFTLPVSPEGSLLVPGMGIVRVLGLNLDEAQSRVRDLVARYYRSVDVRLALARVRTFKVYVVGNVARPGMRVATAATRVSEVLDDAVRRDGASIVGSRNVVLRRATGDSVAVDLVRFLQTGDPAANPILREGDAVVVPTGDERVRVFGRVHHPGLYEYRRGETLAELLSVANGSAGFPANAADTVRLVRFTGPQSTETLLFTRAEATGARGRGFRLQPFDAVYVPEVVNYMRHAVVTVTGEVMRPGTYPIRSDTTTVGDLVKMAGGFTPQASLAQATLRREPQQQTANRSELAAIPPELLSKEEQRILQIRSLADPTQVVVDFARLTEGDAEAALPLRDGDVLHVPERRDEVTVLGAVRTPGIVAFAPGQSVTYFVAQAGGYSRRADRPDVVVLRGANGTRAHWRDVAALDPGDTVIVPFREPLSWSSLLRDTNAIVGTVTGLILAAVAIL